MATARSYLPFLTTIAFVLALSGCRTPQSLCQEYVDSINAMFERCGLFVEFIVVHPRTGEQGCHIVQQIPNPDPIVDGCIPWANAIEAGSPECADVDPNSLPTFCSARAFEIVE